MVQDGAPIRRQGAQDFMAYYDFVCASQELVPLPAVKMNLDKGTLDFNGDRLKVTDWPPVLASISINKHLHHIAISSMYQASSGAADRRYYKTNFKRKIPAIRSKDSTFKLCKALRDCLTVSPNLKSLQLNGLPLRERDLITLTKGLTKTVSLENLSFANCPISDEGLEVICQSVKYSLSIRTVDFTGCNLTWRGAEHMANIIKHQGLQRHGTAWAESLRYRQPHLQRMGGLRRVTLNCNILIGDRGAAALAHELAEDLWVNAVDLQRCGLSNEGAHHLLQALKTNSSLCVLDIRSNPLVDKVLIKNIIEKVLTNATGQSLEYCWIKPTTTEPQRAAGPKRQTVRRKALLRIAAPKGTSEGKRSTVAQAPTPHSSFLPWRTAARAGRQRGLPPGGTVTEQSFQVGAKVRVTVDSDSYGEEDEEEEEEEEGVVMEVEQRPSALKNLQDRITDRQFERLQVELKECRLRLAEERRAGLRAQSRLMEFEMENSRLRDANRSLSEVLSATGSRSAPPAVSVLEDEAVLESIESSFNKFHAFLDLLRDAGLGQLASIAGIDKSDFQPVGQPQLSSTSRTRFDAVPSLTGQDVQAQTEAFSLVRDAPPAPPGADTTTPRSSSSVRGSLRNDRLLDVTFRKPAVEPCVGGEEEPDQYARPDTQHDSGSEHSFGSQRSFRETFQTKHSNGNSNSSSHRSSSRHGNDSHGDSHAQSHSSHSNGSRGGISVRSSVSDTFSDKEESVGSAASRISGKGRLVTTGQSGSEENNYLGRESLEQVRSLGGAGGHLVNSSF
ncbi:centrosomal protein of 78 kDa [Platichthys flesus]|uniref:centrosomal protein of 78 kDa n=1 Tax=Platichthys flesus TaxID=8260 RepID=UPI002DB609DD|nr:centrosomal protein of 78 kDa [Platichthys flesus]